MFPIMTRHKTVSIKELYPVIEKMLVSNQSVKLAVKGNSMYPLLRSNTDWVVLTKKHKPSKYDILFYKRDNGEYILHRAVRKKNNCFYMAGDNETTVEYPVYEQQILASVESFYRNGRQYSCNSFLYRLYSLLWVLLLPFRHHIINVFKMLKCVFANKRRILM